MHGKYLLILAGLFLLSACAASAPDKMVRVNYPEILEQEKAADEDFYPEEVPDKVQETADIKLSPEQLEELKTEKLTEAEEKALEAEVGFDFFLDAEETQAMENYFKMFTHTRRDIFEAWLARSEQFLPYIREVFEDRGLPKDLIYLPFAESGFNAWAYSRAGAAGLWQFMPATGRHYGLRVDWWMDERRNPYKASKSAADYLEKLYDDFNDWYLALAAYNAGEGRVARALKRSGHDNYFDLIQGPYLARETRNYVPKFLAILKIMHNLEDLGFDSLDWNRAPDIRMVKIKPGTDLMALSRACSMTWKEFRRMNPAFRRQVAPPDSSVFAVVAKDQYQAALDFMDSPDAAPYAGYQRYRVSSGDSWWRIAHRFGVPVNVLKSVNKTSSNLLRIGQHVIIPAGDSAIASSATVQDYARKRGTYTVQRGDTLSEISKTFRVKLSTLMASNGISNPTALKAGHKLYIPGPIQANEQGAAREVHYQVRSGDTLWDIARRFGVCTTELQEWNNMSGSRIRPGDRLRVYVP
ncbi:MAG: LysM peptidoglycan-binding domain-containing protein [Desulfonatronovibrionaceae bacterium]